MKFYRKQQNDYSYGFWAAALVLLMAGCGGGGSGSGGAGVGPKGYGTCITLSSGGTPIKCASYVGQTFQTGLTASIIGCTGTGYTYTAGPAACSLADSIGTCTINILAGSSIDATVAGTVYSASGYTASAAQTECLALGGTYTNP